MQCPWMLLAVMDGRLPHTLSPPPLCPREFSIARPPGPPPPHTHTRTHIHPPPRAHTHAYTRTYTRTLTQVSDVARPTAQLEQDSFADGIHP